MKDILPEEMQIRDYVIGVIKETYGKFGFTSIETPCMENIANLSSKQGGENEKLIFRLCAELCCVRLRLQNNPDGAYSVPLKYAERTARLKSPTHFVCIV